MSGERITHHYPTKKIVDGEFVNHPGDIVGRVLPDGSIEGTDLQGDADKIRGGVAYTTHKRLRRVDNDTLQNEATGEQFKKTRKGTGFFSRKSKSFVPNPYQEDGGRLGEDYENCPRRKKKRRKR